MGVGESDSKTELHTMYKPFTKLSSVKSSTLIFMSLEVVVTVAIADEFVVELDDKYDAKEVIT